MGAHGACGYVHIPYAKIEKRARKVARLSDEPGRFRTCDAQIYNLSLYQLSYLCITDSEGSRGLKRWFLVACPSSDNVGTRRLQFGFARLK